VQNYQITFVNGLPKDEITFLGRTKTGAPLIKYYNANVVTALLKFNDRIMGVLIFKLVSNNFLMKIGLCEMSVQVDPEFSLQTQEIKKILYFELFNWLRQENFSYFYFSHWTREDDKSVLANSGFKLKKYATFILNISPNEDKLFKQLNSKKRNMIRKGIENNTIVKFYEKEEAVNNLIVFLDLMSVTQQRAISKNKNSSMQLKKEDYLNDVLLKGNSYLALAYVSDSLVAGALILYDGETQYYFLGGSDIGLNRKYAASDLLHWEIIKNGKRKNLIYYDFGGVPIDADKNHPAFGVYKFKKSFGGYYTNLYGGVYAKNIFYSILFKAILENKSLLRFLNK